MKEEMIEIKLLKSTVFLTPSEIQKLLRTDTKLYKEALKRGKYIKRSRKQKEREILKYDNERG